MCGENSSSGARGVQGQSLDCSHELACRVGLEISERPVQSLECLFDRRLEGDVERSCRIESIDLG